MGIPAAPDLRTVASRYRLLDKIGQGGMGTVWRAQDEFLGRTVAIKEIDLPRLADIDPAELRERALREARAAARLSHPNVVTVHDVVQEDGNPWIVMALVDADSLAEVLRASGPLPPARVAEIGLAVLSALQAAHAAGIVHRDVKPANVLLARDGRIVLTDFGIATLEGDPSLTSAGLMLGAPAYISPERASGLRPEPASDLWSLGATLYTAVEGRPPYDRDSPMATLGALMAEDPPVPKAAGCLTPTLMRLLERDPARRPDAPAARRLLEEALRRPTEFPTRVLATAPPGPVTGPRVSEWTQVVARPDPVRPASVPRWWPALLALTGSATMACLVAALGSPWLAGRLPDLSASVPLRQAVNFAAWSTDRPIVDLRTVLVVITSAVLLFVFGRSVRARPAGIGLLVTVWGVMAVAAAAAGVVASPAGAPGIGPGLAAFAVRQASAGAAFGFLVGWLPALLVALVARRRDTATPSREPARYSPSSPTY
jgi:tRNA A-37 threonylcarbamoyl transferase component Bud32